MNRYRLILPAAALCLIAGTWTSIPTRKLASTKPPPMGSSGSKTDTNWPATNSSAMAASPRMDLLTIEGEWNNWIAFPGPDPFAEVWVAPTISNSIPPAAINSLSVSAIWCQPGHTLAVVNGRILREGADLPPFKVRRIQSDHVELSGSNGAVMTRISIHSLPTPPGRMTPASRSPSAVNRAPKPSGE